MRQTSHTYTACVHNTVQMHLNCLNSECSQAGGSQRDCSNHTTIRSVGKH